MTLYEVSSDVGQQSLPVPSFIPASSQIVGYQSAAPTYSHTVRVAIPNSSSDFNTLALSSAKKHLVISAILSGVALANTVSHLPSSITQALTGSDGALWRQACIKELNAFRTHNTYKLVLLPPGRKALGS